LVHSLYIGKGHSLHLEEISFVKYAHCQKIGKSNNFNVGSTKPKGQTGYLIFHLSSAF